MTEVRDVRNGDFEKIAPGVFNEDFPRPIVANEIDTYARHASAALSPLPTVRCTPYNSAIEAQRTKSDLRQKVANHYLEFSKFARQMQRGADQFYTYGILSVRIELDWKAKLPRFVVVDSMGVYPLWNDIGDTIEVAQKLRIDKYELAAKFPTHAAALRNAKSGSDALIDVIVHDDGQWITGYAEQEQLPLWRVPNPIGKCLWVCVRWPSLDEDIRGRFTDLIWVQIARHAMMMYTMEATANAVEAPIAMNIGDAELNIGPNEIIKSSAPQNIRRVDLNVPQGAWMAPEQLKTEMQQGAIIPPAASGDVDQAVVTGKGVQQLMAGYSQQIAFGQQALVGFFEELLCKAFEIDETLWGDESKTLYGKMQGTAYRATYVPNRDIDGDYQVDVTYGAATGLDPNRQAVFLLQGLGVGIFSKDRVRREMPMDIDAEAEERQVTVEALRAALLGGLQGLSQNLPQMALQGQDPSDFFTKVAQAIQKVEQGQAIEKVALTIFPPPKEQPQATPAQSPEEAIQQAVAQQAGGAAPGGAAAPQGAGDLLNMIMSGTSSSGKPISQGIVSQRLPAGPNV
jgi:hypothetical protein